MNKCITSKDMILSECRSIVQKHGLDAINIRKVASSCNIAVGSIYNYFPSKSELLLAIVEDIWGNIFYSADRKSFDSIIEYINYIFDCVEGGNRKYPDFFDYHSMMITSKSRKIGAETMHGFFDKLKSGMKDSILSDRNVREDAFTIKFTIESFVDMIFSLSIAMFVRKQYDVESLSEIIRRTIY